MSTTKVGQVHVSTVIFVRATVSGVGVGAPALDSSGTTLASLSAGGLLSYRPDLCSEIALVDGADVRGIEMLGADGTAVDLSLLGAREKWLVMLRAADGGSCTVYHDDATIGTLTQRITTPYGRNVVLGPDAVQVFADNNAGVRRWRCPDWGAYVPGNSADWNGDPTSVWEALDRIAARVNVLGALPIP